MPGLKQVIQASGEVTTSSSIDWEEICRCTIPEDCTFTVEGNVVARRLTTEALGIAYFTTGGRRIFGTVAVESTLTYHTPFDVSIDDDYHNAILRFTIDGDDIVLEVQPNIGNPTDWYGLITVTLN